MEEKYYFATVIDDYVKGRPSYPDELFAEIKSYGDIDSDSLLLEIGAGPGTATEGFAECTIDALELEEGQIEFLKKRYSDHDRIHPILCPFEDYHTEKKYDLIYSGTAFHFIDPEIAYRKSAGLLRENGTLALFGSVGCCMHGSDPFLEELWTITRRYFIGNGGTFSEQFPEEMGIQFLHRLMPSELFEDIQFRRIEYEENYDAEKFLALIKSLHSIYGTSQDEIWNQYRAEIIEQFQKKGTEFQMQQVCYLVLARKSKELGQMEVVEPNAVHAVIDRKELGIDPGYAVRHFLLYGDEVLYVMDADYLYGVITPRDLIAYLLGETKTMINRNFRSLADENMEEFLRLRNELPKVHEIPVVRAGRLQSVMRDSSRKDIYEWRGIRETLRRIMGNDSRLLHSPVKTELFLQLREDEQEALLRHLYCDSVLRLFA